MPKTITPELQANALRILARFDVSYSGVFGELLIKHKVINDFRGPRISRQGLGLIGGSIAGHLQRAGLISHGGQGMRFRVTDAGREFLKQHPPTEAKP